MRLCIFFPCHLAWNSLFWHVSSAPVVTIVIEYVLSLCFLTQSTYRSLHACIHPNNWLSIFYVNTKNLCGHGRLRGSGTGKWGNFPQAAQELHGEYSVLVPARLVLVGKLVREETWGAILAGIERQTLVSY
jgi:hypothetical protein